MVLHGRVSQVTSEGVDCVDHSHLLQEIVTVHRRPRRHSPDPAAVVPGGGQAGYSSAVRSAFKNVVFSVVVVSIPIDVIAKIQVL